MIVDTQDHQEWCSAGQQGPGSVLKVSPATRVHLDLKETEEHQVLQDLQVHQDFQLPVVVVCPDLQASQEREVSGETPAPQGCLCQVPLDVRGLLVPRVHRGSPDHRATPRVDRTAWLDRPGVPACRASRVTQEQRA